MLGGPPRSLKKCDAPLMQCVVVYKGKDACVEGLIGLLGFIIVFAILRDEANRNQFRNRSVLPLLIGSRVGGTRMINQRNGLVT